MQGNTAFVKTVKTEKQAKAGQAKAYALTAHKSKGKQWTRDSDKRKQHYSH